MYKRPGYLGGWNQSVGEKSEKVRAKLQDRPAVHIGWPYQCRCGSMDWQIYRGRFYCWFCGCRFSNPDADVAKGYPTFRETFIKASHELEAK